MQYLTNSCFICNSAAIVVRVVVDIFKDEKPLKSGKKLCEVVGEIVKKPVVVDGVHSPSLCSKCHKIVVEYDCLWSRCRKIEADLLESFKKTLAKFNFDYDTYYLKGPKLSTDKNDPSLVTGWSEASISTKGTSEAIANSPESEKASIVVRGSKEADLSVEKKMPMFDGMKIVLSASKLQPLPPNFVLKSGSFPPAPIKTNFPVVPKLQPIPTQSANQIAQTSPLKPFQSKMTVEQKLISNKIGKLKTDLFNKTQKVPVVRLSTDSGQLIKTEIASLLKFDNKSDNVYTLDMPKYLPNAMVADDVKREMALSDDEAVDNPMEIDEECSLAVLSQDKLEGEQMFEKLDEQTGPEKGTYVRLVPSEEVVKLQIIDKAEEDDAEEHTIVVDEDGSIIRLVSGQKLMIGDNEISLVMPGDGDVGDSRDSNDESQIELQVSGDEETANAIIAAAQEQGGAFIKVESGEMYRVQSIQSKEDSGDEADIDFQVERKGDGKYRCRFCEKYFHSEMVFEGDASAMMQHLKSAHDARIYICSVCCKFVRKKSDYVKHLAMHADGEYSPTERARSHECGVCHKKFASRVLLAEHTHVHAGARPHVCSVCNKSFASKYTYQSHMKTHTNRPRPHKCSQCQKSFFTQQNLLQHEKTHSGIKDFVCKICNKAFGTQHNLEVHGVVHSRKKPFACSDCGKAFARRAELRDHARIHTGERPFACEVCGARFTQRSNLYSHRRATHMDDKRYACDRCPKRFKRRRLLDYHIKASHTGERPLSCDLCPATFVYPEHYKKHARIHSGEKPYVCEICGKSFNSRDNRNMHRFTHSERKPYECLVCGLGYMRKQLLYQHMNTRGHMAESIVVNQPRLVESTGALKTVIDVDSRSMDASETMYETRETADRDKMLGKTISIPQDGEATLLTIHNIEGELKTEGLLETVSVDQLDHTQLGERVLLSAGGGVQGSEGVMRLVQVQLPGGDCGWVAVD